MSLTKKGDAPTLAPHDEAEQLFHGVTEIQRKRIESELEIRRLADEIDQAEYKCGRLMHKLEGVNESIANTKKETDSMESQLGKTSGDLQVQLSATEQMQATLKSSTRKLEQLRSQLEEKKEELQERHDSWRTKFAAIAVTLGHVTTVNIPSSDKIADT